MSNFAANPFALLEDESAEPIVPVAKPAQKQTSQKKIPLKEQKQQKAAVHVIPGKTVERKNGKASVKEGPFEEKPEHKKVAGNVDRKAHKHKGSNGGREFDRKSNNPRLSGTEKKETVGKANWGNEVDAQIEAADGAVVTADEEEVTPAEPEVEDSYKSLAEYQAEKEAARIAAQISVRKPNEGVDESQWKKLTPLVKEDKLDDLMFSGKVPKEKERKLKEKPVKTVLEIEQTFAPAPRPERSDRGGRGRGDGKPKSASGPRGAQGANRGRGAASGFRGNRGGPKGGKEVNVLDQNAFPSLSS